MDYYPSVDDNKVVHPIKAALLRRWPPMSQAKLARALDMNASSLSLILAGRREPPDAFYAAAAAVLGCEPDQLRPTETAAA